MKKTRLLEIIREEIDGAINEIPFIGPKSQYDFAYDEKTGKIEKGILGNAIKNAIDIIKGMGVESTPEIAKIIVGKKARTSSNYPPELISALVAVDDAVLKQRDTFDVPKILQIVSKMANEPNSEIPDMSKYVSGEKTFADKLQFPQTSKAVARYGSIEEMAFSLVKGEKPSEKLEPRYKKEKFKKVVDTILSKVDDKKTMADIARELGVIQQKIRPVVSALLDVGILQKGEAESKANPKTDKPKKEKSTGSGKRGRPAGAAKTATRTKDDDGFDKVDYSGDETSKEVESTPDDKKEKFNLGLKFIKKYKDDKLKIDAYMKKAKGEYKLSKSMLDDLTRAAGRNVE